MTTSDPFEGAVHTVMFDLYGTVVDMQTGLTNAITPYLKRKGWQGRPGALVTWTRALRLLIFCLQNVRVASLFNRLLSLSIGLLETEQRVNPLQGIPLCPSHRCHIRSI